MESFILAANVVLPIFLIIGLGYVLKLVHLWDEPTLNKINKLIFKVLLPILLFLNIYNTDVSVSFRPKAMIFAVVGILILFLLLSVFVPIMEKNPRRRGVEIQAVMRSNFVILGIPLSTYLFGSEGAALASMLIAVVIPMYNALSVITLAVHQKGKISFLSILWGILSNPLIIASILGILALVFRIRLPGILNSAMTDISKITTPLALLVLGGSFSFSSIKNCAAPLFWCTLGRLVLVPGICLTIAVLMGFRGMDLAVLAVLFGTPTAVSSFPMAQQSGADGELAGQIVVFTSALSMFSMFGIVFLLTHLGYL